MVSTNYQVYFGNLQSYKFYLRPAAHKLYGPDSKKFKLNQHQKNVRTLLKILAINGTLTTWNMAKKQFPNDISHVREIEKKYRRLLSGRFDREKFSPGILELGLIIISKKTDKNIQSNTYRLSLLGILYCLDVMDFSNKEIDLVATNYAQYLPKLFGKWDFLKSVIGDDVYKIKILSKGLLCDNYGLVNVKSIPFHELMSFISIKFQRNFDNIPEEKLADQISYWFYTNLLFQPNLNIGKRDNSGIKKLKQVFKGDEKLKHWYCEFLQEAKFFYANSYEVIERWNPFH